MSQKDFKTLDEQIDILKNADSQLKMKSVLKNSF